MKSKKGTIFKEVYIDLPIIAAPNTKMNRSINQLILERYLFWMYLEMNKPNCTSLWSRPNNLEDNALQLLNNNIKIKKKKKKKWVNKKRCSKIEERNYQQRYQQNYSSIFYNANCSHSCTLKDTHTIKKNS